MVFVYVTCDPMVFVYVPCDTVTAVCWQMSQQAATLTAGPVSPLCLQIFQLLTNLVPRTGPNQVSGSKRIFIIYCKTFFLSLLKVHQMKKCIFKPKKITTLSMPLAGLLNKGLKKRAQYEKLAFYQEELTKRCSSCKLLKATDRIWVPLF